MHAIWITAPTKLNFAPLTLANLREALSQAPFLRYAFNILARFKLIDTILGICLP